MEDYKRLEEYFNRQAKRFLFELMQEMSKDNKLYKVPAKKKKIQQLAWTLE